MVPTCLAYLTIFILEILAVRRHPVQKRLETFTAALYPTAFPMMQIEPSDLIHYSKNQEPNRSSNVERMKQPLQGRQHTSTEPAGGSLGRQGSLYARNAVEAVSSLAPGMLGVLRKGS